MKITFEVTSYDAAKKLIDAAKKAKIEITADASAGAVQAIPAPTPETTPAPETTAAPEPAPEATAAPQTVSREELRACMMAVRDTANARCAGTGNATIQKILTCGFSGNKTYGYQNSTMIPEDMIDQMYGEFKRYFDEPMPEQGAADDGLI